MTNLTTIDDKTLNDYLETLGIAKELPVEQKKMFLQIAKANNLNPFKKEIYAIPYKDYKTGKQTLSIITGYQTYIARATRTGQLDGWKAETIRDDKGKVIGARVIIYRKNWKEPFVWEVNRSDFDKGTSTWKSMPDFMTKKVAIAQAFRLAFPEELDGMPYTKEEMEGIQPVEQQAVVVEDPKQAVEKLQEFTEKTEEEKVQQAVEKIKNDETIQPKVDPNKITEPQVKLIQTLITKIAEKYSDDKNEKVKKRNDLREQIKNTYQVESSTELTKFQASKCIDWLNEELQKAEQYAEISKEDEEDF